MNNDTEPRFTFGSNWQSYNRGFTRQRIVAAAHSLRRLIGSDHLVGKTFLDIGSGSGLFSLAACLLGAKRVTSFDYDPLSVAATESLRERTGIDPARWRIFQGSILDPLLVSQLDSADVVYSWGVLHHTGAMWDAISNAARVVVPGGLLALAIYNRQDRWIGGSAMWWHIKHIYNRLPALAQRGTEGAYAVALATFDLLRTGDPMRTFRIYRAEDRGMDYWHDVRDWLGGFPYEYASVDEIITYVQSRLDCHLVYQNPSDGAGCNEFTFRATSG